MTKKETISFQDWEKLDIRVGEIKSIEDHPNAEKLYVLKADFGKEGERTIVAGLKKHVPKEDLENKQAVFILNLEPVTLRGIKSEGMILACLSEDKSKASILTPSEKMSPGDKVS